MAPRGIRNHNPGNVIAGLEWQGLATFAKMNLEQRAESRFAVFKAPEYGIRAMVKILHTYRTKHELDTIRGIIGRWAPVSDGNDVNAYASGVSQVLGVGVDAKIDTTDPDVLIELVTAIIQVENGEQPYPDSLIRSGIAMAGGPVIVTPSPGGTNPITRNRAKIQSAIRSGIIAVGALMVGMGYASQDQIGSIGALLDQLSTPELIAAASAALAALWGILDPNKKLGQGDL